MARWKPMTENQKRQQKQKIKHLLREPYPMGLPREQKKLSRNKLNESENK